MIFDHMDMESIAEYYWMMEDGFGWDEDPDYGRDEVEDEL